MDDSIQILDQILPMFTPELSIKLRESRKLNIYNDVKIVLNGVNKNDNFQSGLDENRMIVWDLSFQVFADIMPETEESSIVQTVIADTVEVITDAYIDGIMPEYMNGRYGLKVRETFEPSKTRQ